MEGLLLVVGIYVVVAFIARAQKEQRARAAGAQRRSTAADRQVRLEEWRRRLAEEVGGSEGVVREPATHYRVVPQEQPAGRTLGCAATVVPEEQAPAEVPVNYDAEGIQAAETRRSAAETPAFLPEARDGAPRGMKPSQRAPQATTIASRIESRIVDRIGTPPTAAAAPIAAPAPATAAARLARFAGGGLRGAFVLSEIFGAPRGDR